MNPDVILCPIELSAGGTSALLQAAELARWYDAELHVAGLSSFMDAFDTNGLRLSPVVLTGDPVKAVIEHARLIAADLVVVPGHGRRFDAYWRSGLYATDLAGVMPCPTLAVHDAGPGGTRGSFVNILCPMDFSAASAAALRQAVVLAQQNAGTLTLLHVLDGIPYELPYSGGAAIGEYREKVDRISRKMRNSVPSDALNWCHVETSVVSGIAHRTIVETASALNTDLIVMGLPERSGIARVIMASTTTPLLRNAACPVLLVRAGQGAVSRVGAGDIVAPPAGSEYTRPPMSAALPRVQDRTM